MQGEIEKKNDDATQSITIGNTLLLIEKVIGKSPLQLALKQH